MTGSFTRCWGLEQVKMAQEKHPEQDYGTLAALLNREKEQNE